MPASVRLVARAMSALLLLCLCWPAIVAVNYFTFDPKQLKACYKQPASGCNTLTFQEYMSGQPSRLHLYSILERAPPRLRSANESVLTVVTALNAARLESLEAQCHSWPGPLVAALYAPVIRNPSANSMGNPALNEIEGQEMKELEGQARATLDLAQSGQTSCQLRILLLYEFVDSAFLAALIPINALRNAALLGATTPLVAMIDVDLLISSNLGQELVLGDAQRKDIRTASLVKKCHGERAALILPAFQTPKNKSINGYPTGEELTRSMEMVQQLVTGNKTGVLQAVRMGQLIKFASQQFAIGHRRTDYSRWFETSVWYPVEFIPQFEPWYIVDRLTTPFYDVNFRGYGRNKQQQAAHASTVGLSFWVHPDAFLIHMPHDKSEAQKDHDATWVNVKARQAVRGTGMRMAGQRAGMGDRLARHLMQDAAQESEGVEGMSQGLQHVRRVDKLFRQFVKQMPSHEYQTLLDPASLACLRNLSWWQGNSVKQWATEEKNQ